MSKQVLKEILQELKLINTRLMDLNFSQIKEGSGETDRIVRAKEAWKLLGVSRSTFYELVKQSEFPRNIWIAGTRGWKLSEIHNYIEMQKGR